MPGDGAPSGAPPTDEVPVDRTGIGLVALATVGGIAVLRQRREATKVRGGALPPLGPDGQPDDLPDTAPHRLVAGWQPTAPTGLLPRVVVTLWAAPLTLVGLLGSLLGGVRPTVDTVRACLVARGVGGVPGSLLRGQGAGAATLGQVVLARSAAPTPRLLDHEAVHVRQQERLGPLFAVLYPLASALWGYRANPFEVAARAGAAR